MNKHSRLDVPHLIRALRRHDPHLSDGDIGRIVFDAINLPEECVHLPDGLIIRRHDQGGFSLSEGARFDINQLKEALGLHDSTLSAGAIDDIVRDVKGSVLISHQLPDGLTIRKRNQGLFSLSLNGVNIS